MSTFLYLTTHSPIQAENLEMERVSKATLEEEERQQLLAAGVIVDKSKLTHRTVPDKPTKSAPTTVPGVTQKLSGIKTSVQYSSEDAKPVMECDGDFISDDEDMDEANVETTQGSYEETEAPTTTDTIETEIKNYIRAVKENTTLQNKETIHVNGASKCVDINKNDSISPVNLESSNSCVNENGINDCPSNLSSHTNEEATEKTPIVRTKKKMTKAERKNLKNISNNDTVLPLLPTQTNTNMHKTKNIEKDVMPESNEIMENINCVMEGEDELSSSDDELVAENDFQQPATELLTPTAAGDFRVTSAAPRHKKAMKAAMKKRKHTDDAKADYYNPEGVLRRSAKERRKLVRDEKEASRPIRYYDVVNVKNKNRDKPKVVDPAMASRGHTKKVPQLSKK